MKKIIVCLLFLTGCNPISYTRQNSFIELGSLKASQTWVYFCGIVQDFNPKHMDDLKILDAIGKECNVKIVAIVPQHRCVQYNNFLCWPHENKNELLCTYQEIMKVTNDLFIDGYIGFSNGGFFLIQLAQYISLNKPIIVIGAAGKINNLIGPHNEIDLLIGKQDQWHYQHAINFYEQSKNSNLVVKFTEYDGAHEIPVNILKKYFEKLK